MDLSWPAVANLRLPRRLSQEGSRCALVNVYLNIEREFATAMACD
jgi:hypothetical protein